MSMTRRRSPTWSLAENAERGVGKQPHGLIWLLATMSICLWFFLFYFHFMVVGDGGGGGDQSVNLQPAATLESVEHVALKSPVVDDSVTEPDSAALKSHVVDKFVTEPDSVASESHVVDEFVTEQDSVALESPVVDGSVTELDNVALESPVIDKSVTEPYNVVVERAEWPFSRAMRATDNKSDSCGGRYIYVHDLPSRFNEDMLKECRSLSLWTDMCKFITNAGMGPPLENTQGVFSDKGWYATNQFAVDVIFSNRMKQYECLTNDSSIAAAVFVPFYAGFDIARYLWGYNISMRDAASLDLVDWLTKRPEWRVMDGKDHFLVAGRITWDFRRLSDKESDWGNKLLFLPAARNITMLVVESSPWNANDFGIPYPTYFHPASDADVVAWQDRMRNLERKWLFSFAGAPRPGNSNSIRGQIIDQCKRSKGGKLLECDFGESKCHSPSSIMQMFQSSIFCLQPQGDSYTRRSAFDSMLAGCIPVFFHPGSAYVQYTWHLPKNYTKYSVYIPEDDIRKGKVSIEKRLSQIPPEQVKLMREKVINLIPRLIYADPRSKLETLKDAFDVSVQAMIDRVSQLRRDVMEGHADENIVEENSWKYALLDEGQGNVGPHEWDPLFSKPKDEGRDSGGSSARLATKSDNNKQKDQQR